MMAISRRRLLASTSALLALGALPARAQAPAAPRDTDWRYYANDMAATRYAPLDQINAGNFDKLEVAWRFSTNALGPTLDVIPYVSADGFTIQMTIIPTIVEFLGYDDPGGFVPQVQSVGLGASGVPLTAQLPLPRIRLRQVTTSAIVWDGQTVVLGGLITEDVTKLKDKIPFLGDLPLVGRLFRSESSSSAKKNLMIFVTPTIIDPAGNRMHSEDEMPFANQQIPSQRAAAGLSAAGQ